MYGTQLVPDFRFRTPDPAQMVSRGQEFPGLRSPQPLLWTKFIRGGIGECPVGKQ
jgi:hypothetical protein